MKISHVLSIIKKGQDSASLFLAQQYVSEFGKLAKTNNTVIMPSDVSNINSMVTQVKLILKHLTFGVEIFY
jgi:hypothetical protein